MASIGMAITEAQKQALAANLQLEITERARKLRQNYALMADNLRYRLEMRVNRIPNALRKVNLQELIERATQQQVPPSVPKGIKRTSAEMTDKENTDAPLPNPKKRQKQAPSTTATSTNIRTAVPVTVLSPKSLNSRVIPPSSPHKPSKPSSSVSSPTKTVLPRPTTSPMKSTFSTSAKGYKALSRTTTSTKQPNGTNAVESANGDIYTIQIDEPTIPTTSSARAATAGKPASKTTGFVRSKTAANKAAVNTARNAAGGGGGVGGGTSGSASTGTATTTGTGTTKRGIKSAIASLTSGKRANAAAAAVAAAKQAEAAEQSDAASVSSVPAPTSASGRVLRRRVAG